MRTTIETQGTLVPAKLTICEVHRRMLDILTLKLLPKDQDLFDELLPLLDTAYVMGKKMAGKLIQYKNDYDADWWERQRPEIIESIRIDRAKRIAVLEGRLREGKE